MIDVKFPLTHAELSLLGEGLHRFPSTFEEYWDWIGRAAYKVDFLNNEMIAMSYETSVHSSIATEMMWLLRNIYTRPQYKVHDSNRPVIIEACDNAVFNPDVSVVAEPSELFVYKPGMDAEKNPVLVVEILSKSTSGYDLAEKLPCYKRIPSLRQIIYVESRKVFVSVFNRVDGSEQWLNTDYSELDSRFDIGGRPVFLREIYSHLQSQPQR